MPVTRVSSRREQVAVSLDGVTFIRSEAEAASTRTPRRSHVDWNDVVRAEVETTSKGRAVVRVEVVGVPTPAHHRDDPHAVKVPRKQEAAARQLVEFINDEVAGRRRWRENAQADQEV